MTPQRVSRFAITMDTHVAASVEQALRRPPRGLPERPRENHQPGA